MKNIFSLSITILSVWFSFSQEIDQKTVSNEIERRNITTREDAINELNKNGITLIEAQKIARMQGIDLDTFLFNNFASSLSQTTGFEKSNDVVDRIELINDTISNQTDLLVDDKIDEKVFFGYSIFKNNPFATKNYLLGNIDEGYILSPGDELRITVYGNNALTTESKIDLNGNIIFPQLGVFQAAGNSLKTVKSRLKLFLGKFYNGLVSTPQKTFLDISLTQIRPVNVNILGEAVTPGPHLVSGFASVLNALYAAGGIKTSGSLRSVILYRNNKKFKEFDLYDYITQGNIDSDVRLMSSDIIFIPTRLNTITLNGAVKNSGVYELKTGESLEDLVKFSGGLPSNASTSNVNISRTIPFDDRDQEQVYDKYLSTLNFNLNKSFSLIDGDVVSFPPVLTKRLNEVTLLGNIKNEGIFSLKTYPDLKSLIELGGRGIYPNTFMEKVDIFKEDINGNKSFLTYDLKKVLDGNIYVELDQDDKIRVYSLLEVEGKKEVSISGFGIDDKVIFWRENLSAYDVIFEATSFENLEFKSKVLSSRFDIDSYNQVTGKYFSKTYSLNDIILLKKLLLKPKDKIRLYSRGINVNLNQSVSIVGSVQNSISAELKDNMVVEDAILMAGGFQEFADKNRVSVIRKLKFSENGGLSETINYSIDSNYMLGLTNEPIQPLYLMDNDIIVARTPNRDNVTSSVTINGEVALPGRYALENYDKQISDIIDQSQGLTKFANLNSSKIYRQGKLVAYKNKNELQKQILAPNDQIIIGSNLDQVEISGSGIQNETLSFWKKGKRAKYYIKKSGGVSNRIESKIVQRNNGSSKRIKSFFGNPIIYPGDKIIINKKPEKEKSESSFQDEFLRVFGVVSTTLTTILLVTKL